MGGGRNAPCPCGSGRKTKRCCGGVKPRSKSILLDMGRPVLPHCLQLTPEGQFSFFTRGDGLILPARAFVETIYTRTKGAKVLNRVELDPNALIVHPDAALLKYDHLFAVDTNTRTIRDHRVSVSSFAFCRPFVTTTGQRGFAAYANPSYEFWNASSKPEPIGWRVLIDRIQNDRRFENGRVGVIVDSELGALQAINNRERPIVESYYLPQRYELVYASTDSGKECVANKMISACDHVSGQILDRVAHGAEADREFLTEFRDRPFTHDRVWTHS